MNYTLVARDVEHEIIPLGLDQTVGLMVWSPLHAGLSAASSAATAAALRQPAQRARRAGNGRLRSPLPHCRHARRRLRRSADVSAAQVALNWVMNKPGVDTVIIGARDEAQLRDNLAAATWRLSPEEWAHSTRSARCRSLTRCGISTSSASSGTRGCLHQATTVSARSHALRRRTGRADTPEPIAR